MRNLKKVLTLVLTLAMLLSVMVVGAGAAFSDQDSIKNKEAVDMCTALNIIGGYEDGSFRPNGNVTRAEMCKMLCIVLNGGKEPVMSSTGGTYADVERGNWAEPYIEYCTNLGIVGGVGGGNFAPTGNVTGTQAAKMLLVALGFNPATEGYIGSSNWNIEINVDASQKGLYETLSGIDTENPLTRDQAAQMIWNALAAYMVTYRNEFTTVNGTVVAKPVLVDKTSENSAHKITLLEDKYGVYRVEGIVVSNEYARLTSANIPDLKNAPAENAGKTAIVVTNGEEFKDSTINSELIIGGGVSNADFTDFDPAWGTHPAVETFNVSTGKDELGKAVTLFVRPDKNATSAARATVISHAVMGDNTVLTTNGKWDSNTDMNTALKDAGLKSATLPGVYYVNALSYNHTFTDNDTNLKNGYTTQFIDNNGDGDVDVILQDQVDFGKVTAYTTKDDGSITVTCADGATSARTYDGDDTVGFKDVAKDDYVLFSKVGGKLYVEKAKSVSGVLTDYSSQLHGVDKAEVSLWVDGTKYDNSGVNAYLTGLSNPVGYDTLDEKAVFYLDACGYIAAVDGTTAKHYALATAYNDEAYVEGSITTSARANVTFEDGTSGAPVIDTANSTAVTDTSKNNLPALNPNGHAEDVVLGSYTYNSSDELKLDTTYLKSITPSAGEAFKYTSGNVLVKVGAAAADNLTEASKNVYMTDSTVVFVVETKDDGAINTAKVDKVSTYIGKDNVPSMDLAYADGYKVLYILDGTDIEAMAVIAPEVKASTDSHMYVIKVVSSATNTKTVQAVIGGEIKNIVINDKNNSAGINVNGMYKYVLNSNGNYDVKPLTGTNKLDAKVIEQINTSEKTIVLNNDKTEYKITDETVIANVNTKEGSLSMSSLNRGDIVTVLKNSDNEVLGIYVLGTVDGAYLSYKDGAYQTTTNATAANAAGDFDCIDIIEIKVTSTASTDGTSSSDDTTGTPVTPETNTLSAGDFFIQIKYIADDTHVRFNCEELKVETAS